MNRICSIILVAWLLCVSAAVAEDISGKWKTEFDSQIGQQKYLFDFKLDGETLTGNAHRDVDGQVGDTKITEGKITGDKITFVENLKLEDQEIRIEYSGKISDKEIKLTRKVGDFGTEEIVLKPASPTTMPSTQPAPPSMTH